jgi:hypothetical protein
VHQIARTCLLLALTGCATTGTPRSGSPVTLEYALSELPGPGLCRVAGGPDRSCRGIAYTAPRGSRVLYRVRGESNLLAVCYMHRVHRGTVYGVDVFDVYKRWLVEALLTARDEPVAGDCDEVVRARRSPTRTPADTAGRS